MPEIIRTGPDAGYAENQTGIEKLSAKWQAKVRDSLAVERALFKQRDGKFPESYYELEKKLVDAAKEQESKEGVLLKKIKDRMGSVGRVIGKVGSATLGVVAAPIEYVGGKFGAAGVGVMTGVSNIIKRNKIKSQVLLALTLTLGVHAGYERATLKEPAQLSAWSRDDGSPFDGFAYADEYKRLKQVDQEMRSRAGEAITTQPVLDNLDNFDIPTKVMRHIVNETFPKNCVSGIQIVGFDERAVTMPSEYGLNGVEAAHFSRNGEGLFFTGGCKDKLNADLCRILIHEVGHSNDWMSNKKLTLEDRMMFMDMVASRLASTDRYKSSYVEAIHNNNSRTEAAVKTEEYFAEIFSAYLSDDYKKLPDSDKKVVKWLISKLDPNFDRAAALARRNELVGLCDEKVMDKLKSQFKSMLVAKLKEHNL